MQASSVPTTIKLPFAADAGSAYINTIPIPSQIGVKQGAASFTDGFPPLCFIPIATGGIPPFGEDFNGLLNLITQWLQWENAGAPVVWSSAFSTAIGGYPKGSVIANAALTGQWLCTTENNTTDPDTGGAGWSAQPTAASVAAAIAAETTRAEGVEGTLQTEITAANTAIAAETTRAEGVEGTLSSGLSSANSSISTLTSDVSALQAMAVVPTLSVINSSRTWTAPTTGTYLVEGIGGGGGGGASPGTGQTGSGGSAGSIFRDMIAFTAGDTVSVTIGAGGSAGSDGGSTTFGTRTAGSGVHGYSGGVAGVSVGSGFGNSSSGAAIGIGGASSEPSGVLPSNGGDSQYGTGGVFTFDPITGAPTPGPGGGYGSGGSGGYNGGAGAAGGQGLVIIQLVGGV